MKLLYNLICIALMFSISCTHKSKGSILTKNQLDPIMEEEIDDADLEQEVNSARKLAMDLLDIELAKQLGLHEVYLHEEPLAINFTHENGNLLSFEAVNIDNSNIEKYLLSDLDSNYKIQDLNIGNRIIKYTIDNSGQKSIITSILSCNKTGKIIKMKLFFKGNAGNLLEEYSKLMLCNN
ncbi:MAG TPA: hypothetical protein PKD16_14345 [Saprospiraceae bacterium]|jgi:hypothetical protein|nr:hypothetical protein [Saprospiraceae bacterium]HMT53462.1 hypothetical protein [Saprospiraceae bacterium]HMT71343.1 hypothetical protein [Saprospiraceae bacterium]